MAGARMLFSKLDSLTRPATRAPKMKPPMWAHTAILPAAPDRAMANCWRSQRGSATYAGMRNVPRTTRSQ
jgi:hypothetical protein